MDNSKEKKNLEAYLLEKSFNENFARLLLSKVYTAEYKNARVKDRPDIWLEKQNVGVEVTQLPTDYVTTLDRYKQAWHKKGSSLREIFSDMQVLGMEDKIGIDKSGSLVFIDHKNHHARHATEASFVYCIKTKLKKLQGYRNFKTTHLFIYATDLEDNVTAESIKKVVNKIDCGGYKRIYDKIIIFTYDKLIVFPFKRDSQITKYDVSEKIIKDCTYLAKFEMEL